MDDLKNITPQDWIVILDIIKMLGFVICDETYVPHANYNWGIITFQSQYINGAYPICSNEHVLKKFLSTFTICVYFDAPYFYGLFFLQHTQIVKYIEKKDNIEIRVSSATRWWPCATKPRSHRQNKMAARKRSWTKSDCKLQVWTQIMVMMVIHHHHDHTL